MGNMIIGQSGGPTAVINSSLAGAVKAAKIGGVERIYGMRYGIEGFLQDKVFDLGEFFTDLYDLSLLKRTPSAFLGSCRYKLPSFEKDEEPYKRSFPCWKSTISTSSCTSAATTPWTRSSSCPTTPPPTGAPSALWASPRRSTTTCPSPITRRASAPRQSSSPRP